ncbi:MAG: sigma-70 family RNA polymerase sigma factor [bacterium]
MELTQEYRYLIENIIRKNPRFSGNEDLVEDFCSETFKRSYSVMSSLHNKANVDLYINKIASSAILEVLKSSGRLTRTRDGYHKRLEVSLNRETPYLKDDQGDLILDIEDPAINVEENIIDKEEIKHIKNCVILVSEKYPEKEYQKLFNLRYHQGMTQFQISEEVGISQSEVSKRLTELAKKVFVILKDIGIK